MNLHTLDSKLRLAAANAVYCGNRGETEGGRRTEVQVCQFTSVTVYTNVSVMTHCFIISGTKTTPSYPKTKQ